MSMAAEVEHETMQDLIKELDSIEQVEARRAAVTKSLLREIERLQSSLHNVNAELQKTKDTESQWYEKFQVHKRAVEGYEERDNKHAFVLVLVDGDVYVCRNEFLQRGEQGGREASKALREAVHAQCKEEFGDVRVVVQVYAHLCGLAGACLAARRIEDRALLSEFVAGFTVACDYIDFIDVGEGGSKADRKLLERYHLHKHQGQCKKILLACCNDRDYLHEIEKDQDDDSVRDKLCMIHAVPPERGFVNLNLPHVRYDKVFSDVKLQISRDRINNGTASAASIAAKPGWSTVAMTPALNTSAVTPVTLTRQEHPGIDKAGSNGEEMSNPAFQPGPGDIALNRSDQRVDIPQPVLRNGALDRWRARGMKPCNNFFFGPGCSKQDCVFSHGSMTVLERQAQRALLRHSRCRKMDDCRSTFCYYGHQCPRQPNCSLKNCEFKQLHDKDTTIFKLVGE